tara:strand:+ start:1460 stop:2122 length:663 start_codon:yes stop_codon:yes gene_type:complete
VKGIREASPAERFDVIAQVKLVGRRRRVLSRRERALERVLEMSAAGNALGIRFKVVSVGCQKVGRAATIGVVANEKTVVEMACLGQSMGTLVHPQFTRESDPGMLGGEVGKIEEMIPVRTVCLRGDPFFCLKASGAVLLMNRLGIIWGRIKHEQDLRPALWSSTVFQTLEAGNQIGFVMNRNNDDQTDCLVRRLPEGGRASMESLPVVGEKLGIVDSGHG